MDQVVDCLVRCGVYETILARIQSGDVVEPWDLAIICIKAAVGPEAEVVHSLNHALLREVRAHFAQRNQVTAGESMETDHEQEQGQSHMDNPASQPLFQSQENEANESGSGETIFTCPCGQKLENRQEEVDHNLVCNRNVYFVHDSELN